MKYSIHILTTHKNKSRQECLLTAWLKDKDNYTFYTDKDTGVGNQVEVDPDDTYFSNGKKNLRELKRIYENKLHKNVDWLLFCDDDTFVNIPNLERLLPTLDKKVMYGCVLNGTWPGDPSLSYLSGGAGYLMSSKLLDILSFPPLELLQYSFYSDVCVGLWMRAHGVQFNNIAGFHTDIPEVYNLDKNYIKQAYTFHYVKECSQVQSLLEKFND